MGRLFIRIIKYGISVHVNQIILLIAENGGSKRESFKIDYENETNPKVKNVTVLLI